MLSRMKKGRKEKVDFPYKPEGYNMTFLTICIYIFLNIDIVF